MILHIVVVYVLLIGFEADLEAVKSVYSQLWMRWHVDSFGSVATGKYNNPQLYVRWHDVTFGSVATGRSNT